MLTALILIPLIAAVALAFSPEGQSRRIATGATFVSLLVNFQLIRAFDFGSSADFQLGGAFEWLPGLGISLSTGIDSVALWLITLTSLLGPVCMICSFTAINDRVKTYYGWLLVLQAAMTGVFAAQDLIFFYVCFEFTLVPMYVLISLYGSTNRAKAATKFFLYTFTGSIIALAGLAYVAWHNAVQLGNGWTFDIQTLTAAGQTMSPYAQGWVMLALLAGFAVKVPLFPVHTWLPLAHTEAPTAGSVILAGVLLKLGTYGIFRFVLPFAPEAVAEYAPVIATLSIIGVVYAGLICWVQTDVKKLVAYSSVSHLGFCVLGLVSLNVTGLSGSIMYMINHGLSTGALFLLIGMLYERYHTRNMKELGGLAAKMPVWSTFMVFFTMASVGLPGLNGFVSEFMCMMGAFQADTAWANSGLYPGSTPGRLGAWYAFFAGSGVIVAAMYLLYMVGKVCFGPLVEPSGHHEHETLPTDLNAREIGLLVPLAALCLWLGLYPKPVLESLEAPTGAIVEIYTSSAEGAGSILDRAQPEEAAAPAADTTDHGGDHD